MKFLKSLFVVAATALLSTFTSIAAEAPALDGYCPVCYIASNVAAKGTEEFKAEYNGKTYLFVSEDALKAFNAAPKKFLPQYDGYCAYGMSFGKKIPSDPTVFTVVEGKLYLNKNAKVGKLFTKDTASHIAKADGEWKALIMKENEMMKKEEMMKK
ncbi:MAG: YHS domain-containing (seleno)protein [Akkermansiaceae bacterium]